MHTPFSKPKSQPHRPGHARQCPDCGCDLSERHWQRCPRCQRELDDCGCGGCGACGS